MKRAFLAATSGSIALLDGALMSALFVHEEHVLEILLAHAVLAVATGAFLSRSAPSFVKVLPRDLAIFTAVLSFFVPVLGPIGIALALAFGVTERRLQNRDPWLMLDMHEIFEEERGQFARARARSLSAAEISSALRQRTPETAEHRFRAVLAIKQLPPRVGVRLLKMAQSDPSDEIRLYAFSRLERMRDDLEKRVKQLTAALQTTEATEKARVHLRLAQCNWELGYLRLAEGAVLEHALKSAHNHAATACELLPQHASAEFFLGRILIHLRDPGRAQIAFERAIAAGYPRIKLLPYLAECSFYKRDFGSVRGLLRELDSSSPENVFFQGVMQFWQEENVHGLGPAAPGTKRSLSSRGMPRVVVP